MSLVRRLLTSAVLIGLIVYTLFFQGAFLFSLEVFLFTGVALFEYFTLLRRAEIPCFRLFGVVIGLVIPLVVYTELGLTRSGEVLFLILACLFLFLIQFSRKDNSQGVVGIALTFFGILYVSWFLSFLIKIRFLENGAFWVAYLIAVTKSADIGAYTVGKLVGRQKLISHISPNKTREGFLGGLVFSMGASVLLHPFIPLPWSLTHLMILGILIGMVGQIGDLSESLIKRFMKTKDSGSLLPGMGGVLDAVDSILFIAPIFYYHLVLYKL